MVWLTNDASQNSSLELHNFITTINLLIGQIKDFGGKDDQNKNFEILREKTYLPKIIATDDCNQATLWLYDLVKNIVKFRNKEDNQKLIILMQTIIASLEKEKSITRESAIELLCNRLKETVFQYFFTDGIADLDPKWSLFLLKLAWIVDQNKKFSSAVGRGKISDFTTIDSGNKWLFFDAPPYGLWVWKSMNDILHLLETTSIVGLMDMYLIPWARLVIDHHDRYCQSTSATRMVRTLLDIIDKLPDVLHDQIEDFVTFIDMADDMYYQIATLDDRLSVWTLMWLQRELIYKWIVDIEDVFGYFEIKNWIGKTWLEILTEEDLQALCKNKLDQAKQLIKNKQQQLNKWQEQFDFLKAKNTFHHHGRPFLCLTHGKMFRNLDVTTKNWYWMLQLNDEVGEIKVHNSTWFDPNFLASITHPAIKVMKWRNIFVKANEEIDDATIEKFLTDIWCKQWMVEKIIFTRNEILKKK